MLTEEDKFRLYAGTTLAFEDLEAAIIALIAGKLLSDGPNGDYISGGVFIAIEAAKIIQQHRDRIYQAMASDFGQAFGKNAKTDIADAHGSAADYDWAKTEAGRIAQEAMQDASRGVEKLLQDIRDAARKGYYETARAAKRYVNVVGYENALHTAVEALGKQGITAYTYTRKDGTVVRVPVDVGIRREMTRAGKDRFDRQQEDIARRTGCQYVDVSICADARESHAIWQGQRYQLEGSGRYPNFAEACHLGDLVDGYGGYNCHHTRRLVYDPDAAYGFTDPLAGMGYTNEQVRELTTQQRKLENEIRKAKRTRIALDSAGCDTADVNRSIRGYQARLRNLIGENHAVLRREPWREWTR